MKSKTKAAKKTSKKLKFEIDQFIGGYSGNPLFEVSTRERLKEIMQTHNLTGPQVAELLSVKLSTVKSWLAPDGVKWGRVMPKRQLEFLCLKIQKLKK